MSDLHTDRLELPIRRGASASCVQLPASTRLELFESDVTRRPDLALAAIAICSFCDVVDECRREALFSLRLPHRGVVGGVTKASVHNARQWLNYDLGFTDRKPPALRPTWLHESPATRNVAKYRSGAYITRIAAPFGDSL